MDNIFELMNKSGELLTLRDVLQLTYLGSYAMGEPVDEDWWHGGEKFDLNVWNPDNPEKAGTVAFAVYVRNETGQIDYTEPRKTWELSRSDFMWWITTQLKTDADSKLWQKSKLMHDERLKNAA